MVVSSDKALVLRGVSFMEGQQLSGWRWSLAIKRKYQLLPNRGERVEGVGLHSNMKVESGMLLLILGTTLESGNSLEGGIGA